jgi:predicted DNA-binding transcriptional regulator AlpA
MTSITKDMNDAQYQALLASFDAKRAKLCRISEAAAICDCSVTTLWRRRCANPDFPPMLRNGRGQTLFDRAAVETWHADWLARRAAHKRC